VWRNGALGHLDALGLWQVRRRTRGEVHVCVSSGVKLERQGIVLHRRRGLLPSMITVYRGIRVTNLACTLVDVAPSLHRNELEAAINESNKLNLTDPEALRLALGDYAGRPGVAIVRDVLDKRTFTFTDSDLERAFLRLVRRAGLPPPLTQVRISGFRVDFFWPDLRLVVETDGLRYHRTPAQQARDRQRDQVLVAAGMTVLRFTHAQVRHDPAHVEGTLVAVVERLRRAAG
jgi:very-short-patch-repair endonuclease